MAIYGSLGEVNIGALSVSISATASDIFVYDTRKDSDGGAWRKRTQHTSWYNETLNTATRGSRRDFPAVAVIVGYNDSDKGLVIYDGDDPDFPMWMVFEHTSFGALNNNNPTYGTNSVAMLNGKLCAAVYNGSSTGGLAIIDFLEDSCYRSHQSGTTYVGYYFRGTKIAPGILNRNFTSTGFDGVLGKYSNWIVNSTANDVAMTVLPNAPIDPSTGLPVPTIAVGTNGGTSIIRDDGTVVSGGEDNASWRVGGLFFDNDNTIWATEGTDYSPGVQLMSQVPYSTVNSIGVGTLGYQLTTQQTTAYGRNTSWPYVLGPFGAYQSRHSSSKTEIYTSSLGGLTFIQDNSSNRANSMVAYATTSYNTGWMHGDIKGAFLSDTSTASITGTNLVSGGWYNNGGSSTSFFNGIFSITSSTTTGASLYQEVTTEPGKTYVFSVKITSNTSNAGRIAVGSGSGDLSFANSRDLGELSGLTTGTFQITFTATTSGSWIVMSPQNANTTLAVDYNSISVRIAELDRSVNKKGLAVYGAITKTAVATGTDLVAYSNFNASNYLFQPYNSALDFGTGDFCYMCWVKDDSVSSGATIFQRGAAVNSNETVFYIDSSYRLIGRVQTLSGLTSNVCFVEGQWNHCVFLRRSGTIQIYHNGILQGSTNNTETTTQVGQGLSIGAWLTNNNYFPTSISLFRVSATAPSPEQILKIYNDEKALFQPNSKCTLYGFSDSVTALAYDDTTRILHVGTPGSVAGRSDFQGLERINNTTTAVTTAISASNGLIAEQ